MLLRKHKKQKQLWRSFVNRAGAGATMEKQMLFWQLHASVLKRNIEKQCQDPGDETFKTGHL